MRVSGKKVFEAGSRGKDRDADLPGVAAVETIEVQGQALEALCDQLKAENRVIVVLERISISKYLAHVQPERRPGKIYVCPTLTGRVIQSK